ncbi:MAG: type I methionyl aminopeptidase [Vicinamibacterales bacterium]
MSIESSEDWEGLREVARVTRRVLDTLEAHVRPGITTAALDRLAADILRSEGARSAPALEYGFPGTVLISLNDEIVHGVPGPRALRSGDLVKLDVTLEKDGYVADAARSVIAGDGSDEARRLVACARSAFEAGLAVALAGTKVNAIGRAVDREVRRHGFAGVRGLTGHGVGRRIHEEPTVPNQFDPWQLDVLTDGLVITIEPMVTAGSATAVPGGDGWTMRTADGSLSAHFEHTLVVTRGAPVVLTAA